MRDFFTKIHELSEKESVQKVCKWINTFGLIALVIIILLLVFQRNNPLSNVLGISTKIRPLVTVVPSPRITSTPTIEMVNCQLPYGRTNYMSKIACDAAHQPEPDVSIIQTNTTSSTNSSDPVVHCQLHECGTIDMPSSQCKISGCCVIGDQNIVMIDQNKCTQEQQTYAQTHGQSTQNNSSSSNASKVMIQVDDGGGITKGTFYCYADKVNTITNMENNIRISQAAADSCNYAANSNAKSCSDSCSTASDITSCVNNCYSGASSTCANDNNAVGDLRKQLYTEVHQDCP